MKDLVLDSLVACTIGSGVGLAVAVQQPPSPDSLLALLWAVLAAVGGFVAWFLRDGVRAIRDNTTAVTNLCGRIETVVSNHTRTEEAIADVKDSLQNLRDEIRGSGR